MRSRRLEVVGARKNGRARGRHAETPVLCCAHYFQAPVPQAKSIIEMAFLGEHARFTPPVAARSLSLDAYTSFFLTNKKGCTDSILFQGNFRHSVSNVLQIFSYIGIL